MCGFLCNKVAFDELRMGGRTVILVRNIDISDMHIKISINIQHETQRFSKTAMNIKRSDKSVL